MPPELHDPLLTANGEAEAARTAEQARSLPPPQLVVVSPLRRATQTGLIVFEHATRAGVPVVAHELCRETWIGSDPSIYDSRLSRDVLAKAYPQVDYERFVFDTERSHIPGEGPVHDPLWCFSASPYGWSPRGHDEALVAEHAYAFLWWLMDREERTIAVASHSGFLLALFHACCEAHFDEPQVLFTGELRVVAVSEANAPDVTGHFHTNPSRY